MKKKKPSFFVFGYSSWTMYRNLTIFLKIWLNSGYWKSQKKNHFSAKFFLDFLIFFWGAFWLYIASTKKGCLWKTFIWTLNSLPLLDYPIIAITQFSNLLYTVSGSMMQIYNVFKSVNCMWGKHFSQTKWFEIDTLVDKTTEYLTNCHLQVIAAYYYIH